jgi:hypothetical protein
MTAFWDMAPCSLTEVDWCFTRVYCLSDYEVSNTIKTMVYFLETTYCHIPEGCHLHSCCRENMKYHKSAPLWMLNLHSSHKTQIKYHFDDTIQSETGVKPTPGMSCIFIPADSVQCNCNAILLCAQEVPAALGWETFTVCWNVIECTKQEQ